MLKKCSKRRIRWGWLAAGVPVAIFAGCFQPIGKTDPPPLRDPQFDVLRAQLEVVSRQQEAAQLEHQRAFDNLERALTECAARETASNNTLAALRAEIGHVRTDIAGRYERSQYVLRRLQERMGDLQRDQGNDATSIEQLRAREALLESQLSSSGTALAQPLEKIATALTTEKPYLAQPGFIGTVLGAVLALGSGWFIALRNQGHANVLKRQDTAIKLMESYLSSNFLVKYAKAQGLLHAGWQALDKVEARNDVIEIIGFFEFAKMLAAKNRLDKDLLDASKILIFADEFFARVKAVAIDPKVHPEWGEVLDQLPS